MNGLCQCGCGRAAPIAKRSRPYLGHVKGQPVPFCRGHGNAVRRLGLDRYEETDTGYETLCWSWTGPLFAETGYASTNLKGRKVSAHRAMYERHVGPIPEGRELDHLCRNRACVNPDHLEPMTHTQNVRRGRARKFSDETVRAVQESQLSGPKAAKQFGISQGHVWKLRNVRGQS